MIGRACVIFLIIIQNRYLILCIKGDTLILKINQVKNPIQC